MAITNGDASVLPAAAVAVNDIVAAIVDGPTTSHVFTVNDYTVTSGAISASNPAVPPNGMSQLPTVKAVNPVLAPDGSSNVGLVTIELAPYSGDVVDASSPMTYQVSPNALVIVSSSES